MRLSEKRYFCCTRIGLQKRQKKKFHPRVLPRKEGAIALSSQSRYLNLEALELEALELEALERVGRCIFLVDHLLSCR
jgi:hypothetical protein